MCMRVRVRVSACRCQGAVASTTAIATAAAAASNANDAMLSDANEAMEQLEPLASSHKQRLPLQVQLRLHNQQQQGREEAASLSQDVSRLIKYVCLVPSSSWLGFDWSGWGFGFGAWGLGHGLCSTACGIQLRRILLLS